MKSKGLPDKFPVEKLSEFNFGDVDAFRDNFLFHAFCYTDFVELARQNNRTLLIGPKGSGKSAIYKAFLEGQIMPIPVDNCEPIIIGISDELKYLDTEYIIQNKFSIYGYSDDFKYALLWDFYILFRILIVLQKNYLGKFSNNLKKLSKFFQHIDVNEKSSLTIFLDKLKNIKFIGSMTDGTTIYTGAVEYDKVHDYPEENKFALYSIKNEINSLLINNNVFLWIMFDKIDDFLVREEYDVQRKLLQGLVITEDAYSQYSHVFVKIFLRTDLYQKIDFNFIGYDKVSGRKVDIEWKPNEMRRFISQRLAFNLFKILQLKYLAFDVPDDQNNDQGSLTETTITDLKRESGFIGRLMADKRQGRSINISDAISQRIITIIFPRQVFHFDEHGRKHPIELIAFLESHFNLANDQPTPRAMLLFLDLCIRNCKAYYAENSDEYDRVVLDSNKEYPLIKRKCFEQSYGALISEICHHIVNYDKTWRPHISKFLNEKGKKKVFAYSQIKKMLGINDDQLKQLLAFLEHIGCLKCICSYEKHGEKCKYEVPVFLQALDYYQQ